MGRCARGLANLICWEMLRAPSCCRREASAPSREQGAGAALSRTPVLVQGEALHNKSLVEESVSVPEGCESSSEHPPGAAGTRLKPQEPPPLRAELGRGWGASPHPSPKLRSHQHPLTLPIAPGRAQPRGRAEGCQWLLFFFHYLNERNNCESRGKNP